MNGIAHRARPFRLAAAFTCLMLLGGCGGGGDQGATSEDFNLAAGAPSETAAAAAGPSACSIVTADDAAKAIGTKVERDGANAGEAIVTGCSYFAVTEDVFKNATVGVSIQNFPLASLVPADTRAQQKCRPLEGFGGEALLCDFTGLMVAKGDRTLQYSFVGAGAYDRSKILEDLARATHARFDG